VAAQCGYSNGGTATACWNRLRRNKLVAGADGGAEKKSPVKAKAKKEKEKEMGSGESPTKKRKVMKKEVVVKEEAGVDSGVEADSKNGDEEDVKDDEN